MEENSDISQNEVQKMTFKESIDKDVSIKVDIQTTESKEELDDSDSHSDTPPLAR